MKSKTPTVVLAVIGAVGALFLGFIWITDYNEVKGLVGLARAIDEAEGGPMASKFAELKRLVAAAYLLVIGGLVGIGAAIAFKADKIDAKLAGMIFVACAAIPGILAFRSLLFTFLLIVAGLLALKAAGKAGAAAAPPAEPPGEGA